MLNNNLSAYRDSAGDVWGACYIKFQETIRRYDSFSPRTCACPPLLIPRQWTWRSWGPIGRCRWRE